jgi:hypothetical protein
MDEYLFGVLLMGFLRLFQQAGCSTWALHTVLESNEWLQQTVDMNALVS